MFTSPGAKGQGEEVGAFVDIMIAVSGGGDAADTDATATTEAGGDKAKTDKVDTAGGKPDTSDPAEDKERPGGGKKATTTEQSPTGAAAQAEPTAAPKNPNKGGNGGGKRLARDLQYGPVRREANNATTVSNTSSAVATAAPTPATAAPTPATPAIISKKQIKLGGLNIHLSDQIQIDGKWTAMAAGYPKVEAKGAKMIFTFRFPKFKHEAKYDPLISSSAEPVVAATAAETFKKELARAQTQLVSRPQPHPCCCGRAPAVNPNPSLTAALRVFIASHLPPHARLHVVVESLKCAPGLVILLCPSARVWRYLALSATHVDARLA